MAYKPDKGDVTITSAYANRGVVIVLTSGHYTAHEQEVSIGILTPKSVGTDWQEISYENIMNPFVTVNYIAPQSFSLSGSNLQKNTSPSPVFFASIPLVLYNTIYS